MFKYIGIRGHRGAGKDTISYLLGTAINFYLCNNNSWEGFSHVYSYAVDKLLTEDLGTPDFRYVYFESFADNPKIMVAQLVGLPTDYTYNDWTKDSVIVDLTDFSYTLSKDKLELAANINKKQPYKADVLYQKTHEDSNFFKTQEHVYITLRELISYFSKYVMQNSFGKDVWVKSLEVNRWESERFFADNKTIYKIFTDCKFPTEISYIKNNEGIIIKVNRFNNIKDDTNISEALQNDERFDYEINLDGNLLNPQLIEDIKCLTDKILS